MSAENIPLNIIPPATIDRKRGKKPAIFIIFLFIAISIAFATFYVKCYTLSMKKTAKNPEKYINVLIIGTASIIRLWYVLYTDIGTRQHDLGYATLLSDGLVNPGHLGYIEYFAKFMRLPDFNPFSIFSYYHPPIHHIIAAFFVRMAYTLGFFEPVIFEATQIPTFIYSIITLIIAYKTLKLLCIDERKIILPLALISFHPGLIYMTGSIGNDMMATMVLFLISYLTLLWIDGDYPAKYLFLISLSIGIGMLIKMNVVIIACPVALIMLLRLINSLKSNTLIKCIKEYIIFALISLPIGLLWSVRNYILFHIGPGISSADSSSIQYMGDFSLWQRLGWPERSMLSFPFHSESAAFCHNIWQILFETSVFTEIWPADISPAMLLLCRLVYILTIITALLCAILSIIKPIIRIRRGSIAIGTFLLSAYLTILATYILFVIKYPYTCSCDFRYIAIVLLFSAISLLPVQSNDSSQ